MLLKKCHKCNKYTLKNTCDTCKEKTLDAHYKYRDRFKKEFIKKIGKEGWTITEEGKKNTILERE